MRDDLLCTININALTPGDEKKEEEVMMKSESSFLGWYKWIDKALKFEDKKTRNH